MSYPMPTGWVPQSLLNGISSSPVITPEFAAQIEDLRMQYAMMGQPSPYPEAQVGADAMEYLTNLSFSGNSADAANFAQQLGISPEALNANVTSVNQESQDRRGSNIFGAIGNLTRVGQGEVTNPLDFLRDAATLGAIGYGTSFLGGGAGAGAGETAAVAADGLTPITVSATPLAGGVPAIDAATAAAWGGSIPALSSLPAAIATPAASSAFTGVGGAGLGSGILDSSGSVIPGTEVTPTAGGGGILDGLLGGLGGNWPALIGGILGAIDARNQPDSMTTSQGGTSTSTYGQTLPAEITGPAGEALAALQGLFNAGYNVAGIDPASTAAISGLQGFAGGGGINPYLDTVFGAAADATQNRLASEFARAGRNVSASLPARSQELQQLAAGIYGPGYEAERQRQFGSLLPLLGAGDYLRGIEQQQLDAPTTNLMRYFSGLQGLLPFFPGTQTQSTEQTGSVTQPLFSNPWAGFLGGAQLGSLFSRG